MCYGVMLSEIYFGVRGLYYLAKTVSEFHIDLYRRTYCYIIV